LTNLPVERRAAPARSVLEGTGLVDEYFSYPLGTRDFWELRKILRSARSFAPDVFIFLASRPTAFLVVRDYLFCRLSGARRFVGFPFTHGLRTCRAPAAEGGLWESEADRLARCLAQLGDARADDPESWDLRLSPAEIAAADSFIGEALGGDGAGRRLLGVSVGTKQAVNDWGDNNWKAVLDGIHIDDVALVLVGSGEDRNRSELLAADWRGPVVNACGRLTPRESAALIKRTELFLCHDSGPMHLAAAVGTRCVALFSKKNRPGEWFPYGDGHKTFYPPPGASSMQAVFPKDVASAVRAIMSQSHGRIP
jgi:heptosyltransferase-3